MAVWKPQMNESAKQIDEKSPVLFPGRVRSPVDPPVRPSKVAFTFATGDTMRSFPERPGAAEAGAERDHHKGAHAKVSSTESTGCHQTPWILTINRICSLVSLVCKYFTN